MKSIFEIIFALAFTALIGNGVFDFALMALKKEVFLKIQKGQPSLQSYTKKLIINR